jgi:phage tail-like protein
MQQHAFWLFDVAPIDPLALPIFSPLIGFSAITAPELTIQQYEINEANWYYTRKVTQRASVSSMTLSRASRWTDSDFWRWTMAALTGDTGGSLMGGAIGAVPKALSGPLDRFRIGGVTPRRNLLLVHFLAHSAGDQAGASAAIGALALGAGGLSAGSAVNAARIQGASALNVGPYEFAPRLPGKAWLLYGCLPTRYKAGSDFDASSGAVSIQELEISVDHFDEINLKAG